MSWPYFYALSKQGSPKWPNTVMDLRGLNNTCSTMYQEISGGVCDFYIDPIFCHSNSRNADVSFSLVFSISCEMSLKFVLERPTLLCLTNNFFFCLVQTNLYYLEPIPVHR